VGGEARYPGVPAAAAVPELPLQSIYATAPGAYITAFKPGESSLGPLPQRLRGDLVVACQGTSPQKRSLDISPSPMVNTFAGGQLSTLKSNWRRTPRSKLRGIH
jgi:hypothetical protein